MGWLNQVQGDLALLHLAQVGLTLTDSLGELDLGDACGAPRLVSRSSFSSTAYSRVWTDFSMRTLAVELRAWQSPTLIK